MTTTVRMLLAAAALMLLAGVIFAILCLRIYAALLGAGALGLRSRGDESSLAQANRHGAEMTEGK